MLMNCLKIMKKELKIHYEGVAYKSQPDPEICARLIGYIPYWLPAHIYFDMIDKVDGGFDSSSTQYRYSDEVKTPFAPPSKRHNFGRLAA